MAPFLFLIVQIGLHNLAAQSPPTLSIIDNPDDLNRLDVGQEFLIPSEPRELNISFSPSSFSPVNHHSSVNSFLAKQSTNSEAGSIRFVTDNALLEKVSKFTSAFSQSQAFVFEDAHYKSLLPIDDTFFDDWFRPQAYIETKTEIVLPDLPELSFDYWIRCRLTNRPANGETECEVIRILITPTPTPQTVVECRRTLALPSLCIEKETAFKTYLSNLGFIGDARFVRESSLALNGDAYSNYISQVMTSNEAAIKAINLDRYRKIEQLRNQRKAYATSWSDVESAAKSSYPTERDASTKARFVKNVVEKRFLSAVQKLLSGAEDALRSLEEEASAIKFLDECEAGFSNFIFNRYLPSKTFLAIDHKKIYLVDGAAAAKIYIKTFNHLAFLKESREHRDQLLSLQRDLVNFVPRFPQPPLPSEPRAPQHPSITNLQKLGISSGDLEKLLGSLEAYYTKQAMESQTSLGLDLNLNKLVELGKTKAQIEAAIRPTPEQLKKYAESVARYNKAHTEWRAEVERILAPWRARNLNVNTLWQGRKLTVSRFLDDSARGRTRLKNAIRRQGGLDFGGRDELPKNVLFPDLQYFINETVEGATIPEYQPERRRRS